MLVVFRVDASTEIGSGHVMRCLALANALRSRGAECRFVSRALPGHMGDKISAQKFALSLLPEPEGKPPAGPPAHAKWAGVDWRLDANETRQLLDQMAPDWLVVDHYAFDHRWQGIACPAATKLLVIDDLGDRRHACHVLVDQNFGHSAALYESLIPQSTLRLIGPEYALLRPEFSAVREASLAGRRRRELKNLLVTMGGVDLVNSTTTVLSVLREISLPADWSIIVIMGGNAPALHQVKAIAQTFPVPVNVLVDVADMAAHMERADLAISAAGGTTWERCCLGLPSIILETADNQRGIALAMGEAGAALYPGPLNATEFAGKLAAAISQAQDPACLASLSRNAASICDGDGAMRVASSMRSHHAKTGAELKIRPARPSDAEDIWRWRYANGASKYYRNSAVVSLTAHMEWFRAALEDPMRVLLVVENHNIAVGHIRIDCQQHKAHEAEISIYLDPDCRGKGIGTSAIELSIGFLEQTTVSIISAVVHLENNSSRRAFIKAGFSEFSKQGDFIVMQRTIDRRDIHE